MNKSVNRFAASDNAKRSGTARRQSIGVALQIRAFRLALILCLLWVSDAHAQLPVQVPGAVGAQPLTGEPVPLGTATPAPPQQRRIRVFPRSSVRWQARWFPSDDGTERIGVIDSGVNIVIDNFQDFDTIDISTDRLVIWTPSTSLPNLQGDQAQTEDTPLEFYLEGNIVFRQGDRIIYADRMYYNVQEERGIVLNSELLTPVPGYEGLIRLKAEVLEQVDKYRFNGFNAAVTSSRLGIPGYWLQSGSFAFQDVPDAVVGPTVTDSALFGGGGNGGTKRVVSRNNLVYLGGRPIFFWPFLAANLDRPAFYLESLQVNSDRVFGTQILSDWNLYQLFGIQRAPAGTTWTASFDYLSKRGFGVGTNFTYDRIGCFGHGGRTHGFLDAWGIRDSGLDNLGRDRRALFPEQNNRGRVLGRHRHYLHHNFEFTAEVGYISDRNFLEQYYENEWDEEKDQTTGIMLKKRVNNHSWSLASDARVNDFLTQTEWLPRFDHFWLGQPVLGSRLIWHSHTNVGYPKLRTASDPLNPEDLAKFDLLAWEADREGLRASSRNEISLPLNLGPSRIVPYALGEATYWKEDLAGNEADRLFGQLGIRSSVPFWTVNPNIRSPLWNVNGIAHKVVLQSELLWAESNYGLENLPLYDPLDDDSIEFFRRRFFFDTFGGVPGGNAPLRFDERTYALRSALQSNVTSPSTEVADDLLALRLGAFQRWQTKRGLPGRQRVVDLLTLDLQSYLYPKDDRDNFGVNVGLVSYDLRWHIGDRVTLVSDGQFDFFGQGLRTASISGIVSRPGRSKYVAGLRSIEGPISSNVLFSSASYRLSQKWIANYGSTIDLKRSTGSIGQRAQIVRIGESFLVGLGFYYDRSRDNLGLSFSVEPRILAGRLGRVGGVPIPPVGVAGLE